MLCKKIIIIFLKCLYHSVPFNSITDNKCILKIKYSSRLILYTGVFLLCASTIDIGNHASGHGFTMVVCKRDIK